MCTKHHACRSQKIAVKPSQAVSCAHINKASVTISSVITAESDCCSSSDCGSGGGPSDEESEPSRVGPLTYRWKIEGMDCPSCARKVETAVIRVKGVTSAKVIFATEKLIIQTEHADVATQVENAIIDSGFSFATNPQPQINQPASHWPSVIKQNAQILAIASAMIVAAIIQPISSQLSHGLFVVTCQRRRHQRRDSRNQYVSRVN